MCVKINNIIQMKVELIFIRVKGIKHKYIFASNEYDGFIWN